MGSTWDGGSVRLEFGGQEERWEWEEEREGRGE